MPLTILQGAEFKENMRKTLKMYVAIDPDDEDLIFIWDLYSSVADEAPEKVEDPCKSSGLWCSD